MRRRSLVNKLVPPDLYFGSSGGFHPYDYVRCVVVLWPCQYCGAKRGQFCRGRVHNKPTEWTSTCHSTRRADFMDAKRFDKKLQEAYAKLKTQCFQQAQKRWLEFQILDASPR